MIEKVHARVALLALLVLLYASLTFSQQKERKHKSDAAQNSAPATSAPAKDDKDDKDEKKEGDPLFRGMKYRSIGPFRGGRSLTAAGIPGDPTTYYFGVAGGGVWKSTDGANTWSPVFDKDGAPSIGSIAVAVFDPKNPSILFASLWQARRTPWSLSSGGPGSGVYRSTDGGTTWKRLQEQEHGLPKGPYGRIGLAVGANSERVYAIIEAKEGGLYRSDDGGDTWDLVNGSHGLFQRPWYYMHVIADPQDANTVYVADVEFFKS